MTTTRYRTRTTTAEAIQWTGENSAAMAVFAGDRFTETGRPGPALKETDYDDWFDLRVGDWVVRREGGWFGVLDDPEFSDRYETVEAQRTEPTAPPADLPERLRAVLTERFTALGNPYAEMRRNEKSPDGWPASHPLGPNDVAEVLRELLDGDEAQQQDGSEQ
ncbi:hypothetical protein [Streptomyces sp. NPDC056512]|uniref:hypothetical protein n=1 Tax=Streptomyces sp. NPDC056512 TaxID=3345846 RepID=UPI0036932437